MKYLSDSGAPRVDIRVDYPETFVRTITLKKSGSLLDMAYYDAEFLIWYSEQDKILENFNFTNGKLQYISTGKMKISEDLTISKGVYKYHFMIETPNGVKKVLFKGDFIFEREHK
jgi:hypothetical protein